MLSRGSKVKSATVWALSLSVLLPPGIAEITNVATAGDGTTAKAEVTTPNYTSRNHFRVTLRDVSGRAIGNVTVTGLHRGGNLVSVKAWNLTPGFHGIHIHSVGVCDPGGVKPFASAGGHFNPTGTAEGMQAGAFPVLLAGADGQVQTEFVDSNFTITDLSGSTGAAIVVHAGPDNFGNIPTRYSTGGISGPDMETQMTGDSGPRFACGVINAPKITAPTGSQPNPTQVPTTTPTNPTQTMTPPPSGHHW